MSYWYQDTEGNIYSDIVNQSLSTVMISLDKTIIDFFLDNGRIVRWRAMDDRKLGGVQFGLIECSIDWFEVRACGEAVDIQKVVAVPPAGLAAVPEGEDLGSWHVDTTKGLIVVELKVPEYGGSIYEYEVQSAKCLGSYVPIYH